MDAARTPDIPSSIEPGAPALPVRRLGGREVAVCSVGSQGSISRLISRMGGGLAARNDGGRGGVADGQQAGAESRGCQEKGSGQASSSTYSVPWTFALERRYLLAYLMPFLSQVLQCNAVAILCSIGAPLPAFRTSCISLGKKDPRGPRWARGLQNKPLATLQTALTGMPFALQPPLSAGKPCGWRVYILAPNFQCIHAYGQPTY